MARNVWVSAGASNEPRRSGARHEWKLRTLRVSRYRSVYQSTDVRRAPASVLGLQGDRGTGLIGDQDVGTLVDATAPAIDQAGGLLPIELEDRVREGFRISELRAPVGSRPGE